MRFRSSRLSLNLDFHSMRDSDIRPSLIATMGRRHCGAVVIEELPLCRRGRADVAVVNSSLWGYEIKSELDTTRRLAGQVHYYDCVFDFSTIITASRHVPAIEKIVPSHWGIETITTRASRLQFQQIRPPTRNQGTDLHEIILLTWKPEGLHILRQQGIHLSPSESLTTIWKALHDLPCEILKREIRNALIQRFGLGADSRRR